MSSTPRPASGSGKDSTLENINVEKNIFRIIVINLDLDKTK